MTTNSDDQPCHSRPEPLEAGENPAGAAAPAMAASAPAASAPAREVGGRGGPDPTRYGDWELRGRCIDF